MPQFLQWHYRANLPILLVVAFLIINTLYLLVIGIDDSYLARVIAWSHHEQALGEHVAAALILVPCVGPRGTLLPESADDQLNPHTLEIPYPRPLGGSYEALSLNKTWMTADDRYGPYGYGDDTNQHPPKSHVDWDLVNWGALQDACLSRNDKLVNRPRMSMPTLLARLKPKSRASTIPQQQTGKSAIVIRTWEGYKYEKEDMVFLRSLIVETCLSSGGKYSVFLLVDVKSKSRGIFSSTANYEAAIQDLVPLELQSIAVLFDESLLEQWYPKIEDHSAYRQNFQPLQLFSQFYRNFDYYWQIEMDVRFTGDALLYLEAVSGFAKQEPRKQSIERASFRYLPEIHGTYQEFVSAVNTSVEGRGIWGPYPVPEVTPLGPVPPHRDPIDDDFSWGVGAEADFIPFVPCKSLPLTTSWQFRNWIFGFAMGAQTPRLFCPQAVSRSSRQLLDIVHAAQREQGLAIASEATMASFAMWHGLKISHPPHPWFVDPPKDVRALDEIINGSPPKSKYGGFAYGTNSYDKDALYLYNYHTQTSLWWRSDLPRSMVDYWLGTKSPTSDGAKLPGTLRRHNDQIYAANMALHPVKTNHDKS